MDTLEHFDAIWFNKFIYENGEFQWYVWDEQKNDYMPHWFQVRAVNLSQTTSFKIDIKNENKVPRFAKPNSISLITTHYIEVDISDKKYILGVS